MVDRDLAPHDAAHETNTVTDEELAFVLDTLVEGGGHIDSDEGTSILKCMIEPTERLTPSYLADIGLYDQLKQAERIHLYKVQEILGMPQKNEDVFVQRMDPKKMHWYISSELGHILPEGQRLRVLNDEFRLFTAKPYDLDNYPEGLDFATVTTSMPSTNPALLRLNALFPGLCKTLLDYGTEKGTRRKSMSEFYKGLIDDSSDEALQVSRKNLVLFALADSLLQRLVRPDDGHYQELLFNRAAIDLTTDFPHERSIPKYDEVEDHLIGHDVAHRQLW